MLSQGNSSARDRMHRHGLEKKSPRSFALAGIGVSLSKTPAGRRAPDSAAPRPIVAAVVVEVMLAIVFLGGDAATLHILGMM